MGGVGSMYGEDDSCIQAFGGGKPEKKRQLEDPGVDGKKILTLILLTWRIW